MTKLFEDYMKDFVPLRNYYHLPRAGHIAEASMAMLDDLAKKVSKLEESLREKQQKCNYFGCIRELNHEGGHASITK